SGSHYQLFGEGCPVTCYDLLAPRGCQSLYRETCQCDDGYALSGEECVPLSECGCASGGMYYRPGEVTYRGQSCQEQCTCQPDGSMECVPSSCREGEVCRRSGGVLACRPVGTASCQTTGHQHYRTFDGRSYSLTAGCASVLAKVATATAGLPHFTVMVGDARAGSGDLHGALSRSVTVEVGGHQVTMWPGVTSKVQ
ncbi:hypothetical protein chiPu_0024436, partial [Chiloscyllium punctatum]|nr:hypothetical protein [Chiloscyllium punctatum]